MMRICSFQLRFGDGKNCSIGMAFRQVLTATRSRTVRKTDRSNVIIIYVMRYVGFFTQYCAGDKIENNEMGWACGAYG